MKVQQLKVEELPEVKDVCHDHDQVVGELNTEDLRQKTLEEQLDVPAPARPGCQPPLAPLSEAREGTKDYKRSCKERINQIFPHHHTVFLMKM